MEAGCPDQLIGKGSKNPDGSFNIPLEFQPGPGAAIYATDGCTDPGLVGPAFIILAPETAPLLSATAVVALIAMLGLVGFAGLSRRRWT